MEGNTTIGELNPIRYRGYYYDTETELYYLNSRYYDPEVCRFINADKANIIFWKKLQNNSIFVYSENNPVNYTDKNGEYVQMIVGAVIGAFLNAAAYLASVGIESILDNISWFIKKPSKFLDKVGKSFKKKFKWYKLLIQLALGAISGAVSMSTMMDFLVALINAAINIITNILDETNIILLILDVAINFILDMLFRKGLTSGNQFNTLGKNLIKKLKTGNKELIKKAFKYYFSQTWTNYVKYFKSTLKGQIKEFFLGIIF